MKYSTKNIMGLDFQFQPVTKSKPIPLDQCSGFCIQLNYYTAYNGFYFWTEVSNDYEEDLNGNVINPGTWDVLDQSLVYFGDSLFETGSKVWNIEEANYLWARTVFTPNDFDPYGTGQVFAVTKGN